MPADAVTRRCALGAPVRQAQWGALVALYLFLGGIGSGAYVIVALARQASLGVIPGRLELSVAGIDLGQVFLLLGPGLVGFGALLLVLDLGRNRALFLTASRNPRSSWMARGFLILTGFIVSALLVSVGHLTTAAEDGAPVALQIAEVVSVLLALATAAYTGLLLRSMKYVGAWNSALVPIVFLVSALSGGVALVLLGLVGTAMAAGRLDDVRESAATLAMWDRNLLLVEALALVAWMGGLWSGPSAGRRATVRYLLRGRWAAAFWLGVVGTGIIMPIYLETVGQSGERSGVALAGAAVGVLVGGLLLRWGVLSAGFKEPPPLHRYAGLRSVVRQQCTGPAG